jgi:carboxypeptidase C (cathepsin A)
MKYVLEDLLRVRNHRQECMQELLLKAKRALEAADQQLQQQCAKQTAFLQKKPQYVQGAFDAMLQKMQFKRNALDLFHLKLEKLDEYQMKLAIAVEKAQNKYDDECKNVEQCVQAVRKAQQEVGKIDEHKKIWQQAMHKQEEYQQDKELEDFKLKQ